jgi:cyclohexyl-isocyanide hydratase
METGIFLGVGVSTAEALLPARILEERIGTTTTLIGLDRNPVAGHSPGRSFEPDTVFQGSRPDVLVIPGGFGSLVLARNQEVRNWLSGMVSEARAILTISTGSLLLASTGALENRAVAGHWLTGGMMRRFGAQLSPRSVTTTGNIVSAAGSVVAQDAAERLCDMVLYGRPPATRQRAFEG